MSDYLDAIQSLMSITQHGRSLDSALKAGASPLCKQICYGVLRHHEVLNQTLAGLLRKPLRKKDADIKTLLLVGLYGLQHLRQPDHAVVNLAVDTTRHMRKEWASGLVNGVLRSQIRARKSSDNNEAVASLPVWLHEHLNAEWKDQAATVADALTQAPPMALRVNTHRTSRDEMLDRLKDAGIDCHPGLLSPPCIYLEQPKPVNEIPGFNDGLLSVQDEGAQLAVPLLQTSTSTSVLDACAAPGGKTGQFAETLGNPGMDTLTAIDIAPDRVDKIKDNLSRLQLSARLVTADLDGFDTQRFDRILLDAPCSAVGVIRRHPDIKVLRRPTDIAKLAQTQLSLMTSVWRLLNEGGLLLYTTCSILHAENDEVVRRFLEGHTDASLQSIDQSWGIATQYGRQLLPSKTTHDGFYFSLIARTSTP